VTFVPPSSFFAGSVSGTVAVSNFPADQLVHFTQPVTVDVDNFPATQAVTVAALPLPDGAATEASLAAVRETANDIGLTAILQREGLSE
jgi:hypothetical protein